MSDERAKELEKKFIRARDYCKEYYKLRDEEKDEDFLNKSVDLFKKLTYHRDFTNPLVIGAKLYLARYLVGYHNNNKLIDFERGKSLFKEAADAGNHDAQFDYALVILLTHNKLIKDEKLDKKKESIKYLRLSASGGNSSAQFNLGDVLYNGKLGIDKDEEGAIALLKLSAEQGHPKAINLLKEVEKK